VTSAETEAKVRDVLGTVLDRSMEQAGADTVGLWDSLDWINILFALEEAFGIEFGENDGLDSLADIKGLVNAVERRLSAQAGDRAGP
jgi:acyl carrier protein